MGWSGSRKAGVAGHPISPHAEQAIVIPTRVSGYAALEWAACAPFRSV
jgi:hypothetical protein